MCVLIRMLRRHCIAEALDEAHAAHVGRQVVDLRGPFADAPAIGLLAHVEAQALHAVGALVPVGQRLLVDGADPGETLLREIADQRAGDEAAGPGDQDQVILPAGVIGWFLHKQRVGSQPAGGARPPESWKRAHNRRPGERISMANCPGGFSAGAPCGRLRRFDIGPGLGHPSAGSDASPGRRGGACDPNLRHSPIASHAGKRLPPRRKLARRGPAKADPQPPDVHAGARSAHGHHPRLVDRHGPGGARPHPRATDRDAGGAQPAERPPRLLLLARVPDGAPAGEQPPRHRPVRRRGGRGARARGGFPGPARGGGGHGPGQRRPGPARRLLPGFARDARLSRRSATASTTSSACSSRSSSTAARWSIPTTGCCSATRGRSSGPSTPRRCSSTGGWCSDFDDRGNSRPRWVDTRTVLGVPYDIPIAGYGTKTVNFLRLWASRASRRLRPGGVQLGRLRRGRRARRRVGETISKVLYPNDKTENGKELRLVQQYFFVSLLAPRHHPAPLPQARATRGRTFPTRSRSSSTTPIRRSRSPSCMRILVDEEEIGLGHGLGHRHPHVRLHEPHAPARGAREVGRAALRARPAAPPPDHLRDQRRGSWRPARRSGPATTARSAPAR